jgi:hypothetical protein
MNTEKNVMNIYEFVLYTAHEDKLPGFHRIPKKKNNVDHASF